MWTLLLGFAACCTLADSFGGLKETGKRCETGHAREKSIEYCMDEVVVEDKRWLVCRALWERNWDGTVQSGKR
ncbi:hypothetical protein DFH94DRAFT_777380 [Russula ochroleuca]|uniref:Uncharacterized protein n=1 Tax=Russula ochroleuca TaxID=152965 RepID=A0A9P5JXE3_9AGAM|nr:hypothetical protein DFH94DRAFT_777380 [Russula ochroleuca]